ncbi:hypothetical protein PSE10C_37100 [Pseudomonas amygdali pv. eriobotryae]|uniref:Uncharacterized protein n=2 Tax=Pseudomonas amygdali pv. eriobotryae TaxID=129137 RepID=A0A3M3AJV7_PSEA0|nr:phage tail tube protein [Pseudomonas amygdali]RMM00760.1 hypothetical protein ALQ86_00650 [Pseudomonas amygdali pv. eriobotryae]RMO56772.1 hypothetical protein ALQ39_02319 [Pseudomonas amygdali pv. eriobotryae]GFZ62099.1 hypothetical protein PSE10A_46100 [Pseudomonas amygdali pv. eriobotryae]GFZ72968.1 hypothetical protein PSE10C_37100 [Pseudomonas amygdali pv. eriobotryae]
MPISQHVVNSDRPRHEIAPSQNVARTMSSREIADLTGKRHPDVKRDIQSMASELQEDVSSFAHIYLDSMNRQQTEYLLDREHTPTGTWDTLRLTGNALTPTVNTEVSDEITDTRLSQGSVATSIDIGGDLSAEFSFGSFDQLLEAAFYGVWTGDVLRVGDTRNTFSIAKGYNDISVYGVFKGAHVSTFALEIPEEGKVTATFNMACLDYTDSETPIVVTPNAPTTTPFLSNNNVGTILVNGQSLEGVACVSAMTINLDNSLQTQRCLGSERLGPGAHIATEAAITGSITLAWSKRAWQIWKNTFTRLPIAVEFPITDSLGNKYTFSFPAVEVDGELPNGGKRDLIQIELNYTVAKQSPTITRLAADPDA